MAVRPWSFEPQAEFEARRADIYSLRINAAPAALNYSGFGSSTASRPWLFNDGPLDLTCAPFDGWFYSTAEVKYVIPLEKGRAKIISTLLVDSNPCGESHE